MVGVGRAAERANKDSFLSELCDLLGVPRPDPTTGDAVLTADGEETVLGEDGKPLRRWNGRTMKKHPVTGEHVPDESAQLVMLRRFGLITTNSITQALNRKGVKQQFEAKPPLSLAFAVPDHPWVDTESGAAVRIAMTVGEAGQHSGRLMEVIAEGPTGDDEVEVELAARIVSTGCEAGW